jgi:hypothetical protein
MLIRRIKDHPRTSSGHKIRLWCSQDEAHKSKHSKSRVKPRVSADGVAVAKLRFPCRSGLLISSRDSGETDESVVVVRMHHHYSHEPYYDTTLPPEMKESIWESMGWGKIVRGDRLAREDEQDEDEEEQEEQEASDEEGEGSSSEGEPVHPPSPRPRLARTRDQPSRSVSDKAHRPHQSRESMQRRMKDHIRTLRDFADLLESQEQSEDSQSVDELEKEGAGFLDFARRCLRREEKSRLRFAHGRSRSRGGMDVDTE